MILCLDDYIKKLSAEEAIEVAHAAANRWTGLPSTPLFSPLFFSFLFSYLDVFGSHRIVNSISNLSFYFCELKLHR